MMMAEETGIENADKGKKRKRIKKLCSEIREQMEFYFSDSNLHKDRFLGSLLKESSDGYVDLELFSRFNKLRCLTTDMSLVAKALTKSDMLEVSEDNLRVKRIKPPGDMSDVDERTVYVEYLPPSVTHDWIKQQFSTCGKVLYVSLPKFQSTGDPKGFAFVEFATKAEADEACELLNNPPAIASERVGKFPRSNKQLEQLQKQLPPDASADVEDTEAKNTKKRKHEEDGDMGEEHKTVKNESQENPEGSESNKPEKGGSAGEKPETRKKKRKRKSSECSVDSADIKVEKVRKVSKTDADATRDVLGSNGQNRQSLKIGNDNENTEKDGSKESKKVRISDTVEISITEPHKKKRKRRKAKTKEKNKPKDMPELRVIPKQEWLQLRKEYLKLQKKSMSTLKKNLNSLKHHSKKKEQEKAKKTLDFVPNVIVKIESDQPTDRKTLKGTLGNAGNIAYIDVDKGEHLAHIRCQDAESAKSVATKGIEGYTLKLLQGEEEKCYWDKLHSDQERKLSQPRLKKRGTQKLVEKADRATMEGNQTRTKHVFFDD